MTIKEVCEKYDITADTLRYYERVGVIPEVTRTPSGIRDYQETDIALEKLDYKISRYEIAQKTGVLTWTENEKDG